MEVHPVCRFFGTDPSRSMTNMTRAVSGRNPALKFVCEAVCEAIPLGKPQKQAKRPRFLPLPASCQADHIVYIRTIAGFQDFGSNRGTLAQSEGRKLSPTPLHSRNIARSRDMHPRHASERACHRRLHLVRFATQLDRLKTGETT
ncbi:hypothetical protein [Bosea sp. (in: a-proteobacteria)]|uniref:hypothetical protein n=1 Tax=Bosea sp. (in: a-proteobacteria) TaxID=1871050 RepID=UPI002735E2C8|nr:hypothetical protein [Bosea sp. (in: a-proteobacteria)]MDP3409194.1 hypothetical protein [Bosea sp. (in: a-proteobacteria)]